MKKLIFASVTVILSAAILTACKPSIHGKAAVVYPREAGKLEEFAAGELQRYFYLRTGILAELIQSDTAPDGYGSCFIVGNRDRKLLKGLAESADIAGGSDNLAKDGFFIKTYATTDGKRHVIAGGGDTGTLYGAYRLLEHTGLLFGLDGDVLPDEKFDPDQLSVNETGNPRFDKRGLQPFHDFNVGPDWWNLADYNSVLAQMAKLRMNFIGFHTYPSWNRAAGPEANVWIGLPEDVDAQGNVKTGYEAGVVTSRRGWAVKPFPTGNYASGAGLLFEGDEYGPDFMLNWLNWPQNETDAATMFNKYGDFQQRVYENAKSLGISTAAGTELPLGVPEMVASQLKSKNLNPEDPAVIEKLYEGMLLRLMRKTPVDYVWFWMPEIWLWSKPGCAGWEITTEENVQRDIKLILSAAEKTGITSGFATSGWRLGTVDNARWTDENTPKEWAMSSINTSGGGDPVEKLYSENTGRPRWVIGWAEDDGTAGAHCCTTWDVQFWVDRMLANSADAFRYGVDGMMAIHWRTSSIAPNISALAHAGWHLRETGAGNAADPGVDQDAGLFWDDWGRRMFGGEAGARAGRILQKFDACHPKLNQLVNNGCKTTDQNIDDLFAPLREFEALGSEIRGPGNKIRFDYWFNYLDASRLRVNTWVLSSRLDSIMARTASMADTGKKRQFIKEQALPARIALARSWEAMIAAYLGCTKSPGDVGTISSIESGNRKRILHGQDSLMANLLGAPLPPEASVRTDYNGTPRIFISSDCTRWKTGEPFEIRPFVLSSEDCKGVSLYWRPLGKGVFSKVEALYKSRHAYRVILPENDTVCVEYYLEASLANGKKIRYPATAPEINSSVVFRKN
jgi:hypothetical protein